MHKIISTLCLASFPLFFAACSDDNAIEVFNNEYSDSRALLTPIQDKLQSRIDRIELYKCAIDYGESRCLAFFEKDGKFDMDKISDKKNYNDKGEYIGKNAPTDNKDKTVDYLLDNKILVLELNAFSFKDESIMDDYSNNPEVKFTVTTVSDGINVNIQSTPILLDSTDINQWKGFATTTVNISRGVDKIILCPDVSITDEELDDITLESDECIQISKIGRLDKNASDNLDFDDTDFTIKGKWTLR